LVRPQTLIPGEVSHRKQSRRAEASHGANSESMQSAAMTRRGRPLSPAKQQTLGLHVPSRTIPPKTPSRPAPPRSFRPLPRHGFGGPEFERRKHHPRTERSQNFRIRQFHGPSPTVQFACHSPRAIQDFPPQLLIQLARYPLRGTNYRTNEISYFAGRNFVQGDRQKPTAGGFS
jgi:hypothetical protein